MFSFFKCKHPFERLAVIRDVHVLNEDADFVTKTCDCVCQSCGKEVQLKYAIFRQSSKSFLEREVPNNP